VLESEGEEQDSSIEDSLASDLQIEEEEALSHRNPKCKEILNFRHFKLPILIENFYRVPFEIYFVLVDSSCIYF
jgi:hypothetical protein